MNEHFNKLTPAEAELLAILAEECGEVVQRIGKILRHGYDDWSPYDTTATRNRTYLANEIGDVRATVARMVDAGDIDPRIIEIAASTKHAKLKRWTHHQPDSEWEPKPTPAPQPVAGERERALEGVIELTPAEIQSNHNRVQWAEGLIRQLPETHEGRNSWLLNYGHGADVEAMRDRHPTYREKEKRRALKTPSPGEAT